MERIQQNRKKIAILRKLLNLQSKRQKKAIKTLAKTTTNKDYIQIFMPWIVWQLESLAKKRGLKLKNDKLINHFYSFCELVFIKAKEAVKQRTETTKVFKEVEKEWMMKATEIATKRKAEQIIIELRKKEREKERNEITKQLEKNQKIIH